MITYAPDIKNAMLNALAAELDAADPEPGRLLLYCAEQPAAGEEISDQTLLAQIPLALSCGTVSGGQLNLTVPIEDSNLPASGTITWGRLLDGAGNWVADLDVGNAESSAAFKLTGTIVYQGGIVRITAAALTLA